MPPLLPPRPCMARNHRPVSSLASPRVPMYAQNQHESLGRAIECLLSKQSSVRPSIRSSRASAAPRQTPSGRISVKFRFLCQHHFLLKSVRSTQRGEDPVAGCTCRRSDFLTGMLRKSLSYFLPTTRNNVRKWKTGFKQEI